MSNSNTNMHRYTEIPSTPTPTPLNKPTPPTSTTTSLYTQEIKLHSVLTLRNIGKATVRFIGTVDGKTGQFAGLELIGPAVKYGKNSGDVNGKYYFKTEKEGTGLFMPFGKMQSIVEFIDSPDFKRASLIYNNNQNNRASSSSSSSSTSSPYLGGVKHSTTPRLERLDGSHSGNNRNSVVSNVSPTILRRPSSTALPHPPAPGSFSLSALEKELGRVNSSKAIIESERDTLARQTEELKEEITNLTMRLSRNESLLDELQKQASESLQFVEAAAVADERVFTLEERLNMQKNMFEEQRAELFEVIDQVEAQVQENEKLYLAEMNKLQEELSQRQVILDALETEKKDLEAQLKLAKTSSANESTTEGKEEGEEGLDDLRKTCDMLNKAIVELGNETKKKDSLIEGLSKDSLELKEDYINERKALVDENDQVKKQLNAKDLKLEELEKKIEHFTAAAAAVSTTILATEEEKAQYESQIKLLTGQIATMQLATESSSITSEKDLTIANDTIQELQFKLSSKESIIDDLKKELLESQKDLEERTGNDDQLKLLNDKLNAKEGELSDLKTVLDKVEGEKSAFVEQITELQAQYTKLSSDNKEIKTQLQSKDKVIEEHQVTIEWNKALESEVSELKKKLNDKEEEIGSLRANLESLEKEQSSRIEELMKANDELRIKVSNFDNAKENDSLLRESHEAKFAELNREELRFKVEELESLGTKNKDLLKKYETLELESNKQLKAKDEEISQLMKSNDGIMAQIKDLQSSASKKLGDVKSHNEELDILLEEMSIELDLLREESSAKDKELQSLQSTQSANTDLQKKLSSLESQIADLKKAHHDDLRSLEDEFSIEVNSLQEKLAIAHLASPSSTNTTPRSDIAIDSFRNFTPPKKLSNGSTSISNRFSTSSTISLRPPVISQVVDGELQVYKPDNKADLTSGRRLWCGLCERSGHDSIDCPFEDDVF